MDEAIKKIKNTIYTLGKVEIKGKDNMSSLLGCIYALEDVIVLLEKEKQNHETDNE